MQLCGHAVPVKTWECHARTYVMNECEVDRIRNGRDDIDDRHWRQCREDDNDDYNNK